MPARILRTVSEDATTSELSGSLNVGSREQAAGAAQIASALSGLERSNQQNAAGAERSGAVSREPEADARRLQSLRRFAADRRLAA